MSMRFRLDHAGIKQVAAMPVVRDYTDAAANAAAEIARSTAPVATGAYQRSIKAKRTGRRYAKARLSARDFKAWWIEYGAGPSPVRGGRTFPARHVLARSARAVGLRVHDRRGG